jgi:superfamily II DNA or RNA helicase
MTGRESERTALLEAIEAADANLRRITEEHATAVDLLAQLRAKFAAPEEPEALVASNAPSAAPRSPEEKIALFRSLFRGRPDVYPTRFVSVKTGKPGYAPACSNKFRPGVCELPRVKCGECPNQAFRPADDVAAREHLLGHHVMGAYPMLGDETCWFLAVDFDKGSWADDVRAFAGTCRRLGMPVAIERSRSGNGAHAWFFFAEPVGASIARKMGCHVLTETMAIRHDLSMESYDRLFPSQDTMPRGGFGNLIALPLQFEARKLGNSVFLDDDLHPHPDQWGFLATIVRIPAATVERIASEASRSGSVVGVRSADDDEEAAARPWTRRPSGKQRTLPILQPLPARVTAILAQRLFVEKKDLPSPLLNQIKRLAAFQNPEFYKKQSMRLSTALTPRVIACAEDLPQHVALPRGCVDELDELLRDLGIELHVVDELTSGAPLSVSFKGQLTPIQSEAARAMLAHDIGVFIAPPGIGKTVVGTYLVAARARSTLVLVHRQPLLDQWVAQVSMFLGVDARNIGQIGAGKRRPNGQLDVAMLQSLVRKDSVDDILADYGHVIVDECHHLPAASFERVLSSAKARFITGLTATRLRRDGHHPITQMQLGPVRFTVDAKLQANARPFAHWLFARETAFRSQEPAGDVGIQELYGALARDPERNEMILNDVIRALEEGRSPILLTERKDHLEFFAEKLRSFAKHVVVLHGGMGAKAQRAVQAQLAAIPPTEERLVLATGRYIGEGFDDARLDTLFLTLPVSWKGTLTQYAGRLHRLHPGKREVQIFDYVDRQVPMLLRMFEKRLRGYRAIGYARGDAPLGFAESSYEPTVEYDEGAFVATQDDLFA